MDERLLKAYNIELAHLREMGAEFAAEFPKVAARLSMEGLEVADPYVERLLEGFAFMSARVQVKLDAEFPRFTQSLLDIVYPNYLSPTPSFAVVEMAFNNANSALAIGPEVPRGTRITAPLQRADLARCNFTTAHTVRLWPIEIETASYFVYAPDLPLNQIKTKQPIRGGVRIRLKALAGSRFSAIQCNELNFYLSSENEQALVLYEAIMANRQGVLIMSEGQEVKYLPPSSVQEVGFEISEALLPADNREFQGYRNLREYFAFPQRFLFFKLHGLKEVFEQIDSADCEMVFLSANSFNALETSVDKTAFSLWSVPVANLFPLKSDRVFVDGSRFEYQVIVDRTHPIDFEVFSIDKVFGIRSDSDVKTEFKPFYAQGTGDFERSTHAYFTLRREPRTLTNRQLTHGARTGYLGTEVFLSLVDEREAPFAHSIQQLAIDVTATNRDLPLLIPIGNLAKLTIATEAPVLHCKTMAGPSRPRTGFADGDYAWRLIGHLTQNYLSIFETGQGSAVTALQEMLVLYIDAVDQVSKRQIEGIVALDSKPIVRRLPISGPIVFGRGLAISVTLAESNFAGSGAYLFGAVLERFFAQHVSINSFVETTLISTTRGFIAKWPARTGNKPIG
jgi:type VI secretion system protein ImpG